MFAKDGIYDVFVCESVGGGGSGIASGDRCGPAAVTAAPSLNPVDGGRQTALPAPVTGFLGGAPSHERCAV